MTEVGVGSAQEQGSSNTESPQTNGGAGLLLRQAREQQRMSLETVASTLKVPAYKLQALEEDRWDVLTDSVFTRSLALSVCRLLHIPSEPVLAGLPKYEGAKLAPNPEGINTPFKEKSLHSMMSSSHGGGSGNIVKVAAAVLIAVAGGAGLYFLPQWDAQEESPATAATSPDHNPGMPLFEPLLPAEPVASSSETVPQQAVLPMVEPSQEAAPATDVAAERSQVEATAGASPAVQDAVVTTEAAAASTANGRVLRFTATGESWIQVRDAQRKVLMEKILKAGDVYEETVAGQALYVVVGNAGATKLEIDGAALDLAASARNNVARFEVK
ncbi:MAG TPA: RodZ domain-containing protein [Comamonas sp.]